MTYNVLSGTLSLYTTTTLVTSWQTHCSSRLTKQTELDCEAAVIYTHDHYLALFDAIGDNLFTILISQIVKGLVVVEISEYWKQYRLSNVHDASIVGH